MNQRLQQQRVRQAAEILSREWEERNVIGSMRRARSKDAA